MQNKEQKAEQVNEAAIGGNAVLGAVSPAQIAEWKAKAEKWDKLEAQISKCYFNEDGEELDEDDGGDLCDIGELAATAFGFL